MIKYLHSEMGRALANTVDQNLLQLSVLAARASATITGGNGGFVVTDADADTNAASLIEVSSHVLKILMKRMYLQQIGSALLNQQFTTNLFRMIKFLTGISVDKMVYSVMEL